ncbi:hypothetical protein GN956_G4740, partial [Arapaima gigas]
LPVAVQVAVNVFHRGELLSADRTLVFPVSVHLADVGKQCPFVTKDLGTVDALQVGPVRELGVTREHMLL